MKGKLLVVDIFNLGEAVNDMEILKGRSDFLPRVVFCAFTVVMVVDQHVAVMLYHLL